MAVSFDVDTSQLSHIENDLFALRSDVELLWVQMGRLCAEIVEKKLYRFARDESGNYFRTAQGYFKDLDRRFQERGWSMGYTTINRWVGYYRLYKEKYGLSDEDLRMVGKSNLETLAPALRLLDNQSREEEAAELVQTVVDAAYANEGMPNYEVKKAVDEVTGRVMKGLNLEWARGTFGWKLKTVHLWWGEKSLNLSQSEVTDEQKEWLDRRMGLKHE